MLCLVSVRISTLGVRLFILSSGIFRTALPEFKGLQEFEWIGYPELQADMVQALLKNYPNLIKLGLMYILTTYQLALARLHLSFFLFQRMALRRSRRIWIHFPQAFYSSRRR